MSSASPLTKNCPQCRAIATAETVYCACGHRFESDVAEQSSSKLVARAEALYETHLRARLSRARRIARFAKIDVVRDPQNPVKTEQFGEAEKEVKLLEAQVVIQSARAAAALPHAQSAPDQSTPIEAQAPEAFRTAQTIKAEQKFEFLRLQVALERLHATKTTGAFKAFQAQKARAMAKQAGAVQTCPGCGAVVATGATRCDCGFILPAAGTDTATGFLTAEELAALRNTS